MAERVPAIEPDDIRQIDLRSVDDGEKHTIHGGPTYREAQLCTEMIADTGLIGSLDVVELDPALDVRNRTANVAVDLIEGLSGESTLLGVHEPVRHAH